VNACWRAGGTREINRVPDAHARVGISAKWREGWVELAAAGGVESNSMPPAASSSSAAAAPHLC
jgi:hypothetical protein